MIEKLSINVDTSDIEAATTALKELAAAAEKAQQAIDALKNGGALRRTSTQIFNVGTGEKFNFAGRK